MHRKMESLLREENTILKARLNELAASQDTSLRAENEALRQERSQCLDGFPGNALFNIDPGLFEAWDPSNQLWAEFSSNLPLELLKMVEWDLENTHL
jgi:hypothetical protein